MQWKEAISKAIDRCLEGGGSHVATIVERFREWYPDEAIEAGEHFQEYGCAAYVRTRLNSRSPSSDFDQQMSLPGLDLPGILCVKGLEGDTVYKFLEDARWADVCSAEVVRIDNVANASKKLDEFQQFKDMMAPLMQNTPEITVREAMLVSQASNQ